MSNLERLASSGISHGVMMLLAFTVAMLAVGVSRRYCRRLFGAERAFLLWMLPPAVVAASQLPHANNLRVIVLPPLANTLGLAINAAPSNTTHHIGLDWHAWVMLIWMVGVVGMLVRAVVTQNRYRTRLRDANVLLDRSSRWPILRARYADVGPSLVGAWRPRIVIPSDFEHRYDTTEQALILAHESMHAQRCDGWWSLGTQIMLAVFWVHPLAWFGWNAFRQDQELACDAAVINVHGNQRRSYANAMLKTQFRTLPLPVGCSWSPRHPITERIAMLTSRTPGRSRKFAGTLFISTVTMAAAGFAYAASQSAAAVMPVVKAPTSYQLALTLSRGGKSLSNFTLCTDDGRPMAISSVDHDHSLRMTFSVKTFEKDQAQVDVNGDLDEAGHRTTLMPTLRGPWGRAMTVNIGGSHGKSEPLRIAMIPTVGCSADTVVAQATITEHVKDGHVRDVAQAIASKNGYVLVDPDALDEQLITFNFEQIPVEKALQLVAKIDGKLAVFQGRQVRFEAVSGG
jgi:beta-lactamase regulating signal transducer with metallopeptidase domain